MLALLSVWMSVACLALAGAMLLFRRAFTEFTMILFMEFMAPATLCLAGLVLWGHRKDHSPEPAVIAQRLQAKVAIALTLISVAIMYVIFLVLANRPHS